MARPARRQREFEQREQEILDATLALCATPEFEAVTIGQIAARADVGKGTLYQHFASKDELLFRLMLRFYRGLLAELSALTLSGPPLARMRNVLERALSYHIEQDAYRYVIEYCERLEFRQRADPTWRADLLALDHAFQTWGAPLLEAGMRDGSLLPRPTGEVMVGVHACFKGAVSMLWAGPEWCCYVHERELMFTALVDFLLAGLRGTEPLS